MNLGIALSPRRWVTAFAILIFFISNWGSMAFALPPAEDPPEEVLRAEIITAARSPLDGKPVTATEYAQLETELQTPGPAPPQVAEGLRRTIGLLRIRRFIKTFFPFIPIR